MMQLTGLLLLTAASSVVAVPARDAGIPQIYTLLLDIVTNTQQRLTILSSSKLTQIPT
jgi:hypothetical protein